MLKRIPSMYLAMWLSAGFIPEALAGVESEVVGQPAVENATSVIVQTPDAHVQASPSPRVVYDPNTARLDVSADGVPLSEVLGEIAGQTGTEILIDPAVERPVNARFENRTLEEGLKALTRGLNSVILYEESGVDAEGKLQRRVTGMKLLPAGQTDTSRLQAVHPKAQERADRQKAAAEQEAATRESRSAQRQDREARKADKQTGEKSAAKTAKKAEKKGAKAASKVAKLQEREDDLLEKMARLESMRNSNPERYTKRYLATQKKLNEVQQQKAELAAR